MTTAWAGIPFGGDYNPEQWPRDVWAEDVKLMGHAGVDLVTVGVFSWALLQPTPDTWDFGWLDDVLDGLLAAGVQVDLATATASPPPWLTRAHPEMLPVTEDGTTLWPGGRQAYCPSSPVYREHALALCRQMATRYAEHPAVVLWHVSNEIGCHNALCYCDTSAAAFRGWLRGRYGDLETLNDAWGTAFWSQRYGDWDEILPPRVTPATANPTQRLDFQRFSSDELLGLFTAERDVLHELSPGIPVTTNFMVSEHIRQMDYFRWGREVDIVSNDHYLIAADPWNHQELAFSADLTRGIAGGRPWLLMETSTSAVNWQPRNVAKRPGELRRAALGHLARGGDGILFFQWRASRAGAEKFHSGLVPHAGTDTRLWREVCELGALLDRLDEVAGAVSHNDVAILFDWESWWASELDSHPSVDVQYLAQARDLHRALVDRGVGVDVVHPSADLAAYRLVVVPTLYLVTDEHAASIAAAAEAGATVLVTYFSGIVDERDHVRLGGYPGAFRDLLGVVTEEFTPLREGERVHLDDGGVGRIWAEDLRLEGAEAVASYSDGPVPGAPAITRRAVGEGAAWYVATHLTESSAGTLVDRLLDEAQVSAVAPTGPGVEVVRRVGDEGRSWDFVINHTDQPVTLPMAGHDLVTDEAVGPMLRVDAGGVAVVRSD
ncbi:beta-galactosidase [Nocardioides gansuensis]|uniref:Beta-galactosidase n=1 Tax=Nocardioides gansuensis TaxID=2138300 RepID=A0A2T8FGJ7_9ACTN|nr:beta-galactosidase [Nocardioides gansuensis]PVG84848.1 beta-galactosidase [Nocardioides gansuensis]